MEIFIPHTPYNIGIQIFVKVDEDGFQKPVIICQGLPMLAYWINTHDHRFDAPWYVGLKEKILSLNIRSFEKKMDEDQKEIMDNYSLDSKNLLAKKLLELNWDRNLIKITDEDFVLELAMYYNQDEIIQNLAFLDRKFDEVRFVCQDMLSIIIRKNVVLLKDYFWQDYPVLIKTEDLLKILDCWHDFVLQWQQNEIPNLKYDEKYINRRTNINLNFLEKN